MAAFHLRSIGGGAGRVSLTMKRERKKGGAGMSLHSVKFYFSLTNQTLLISSK